MRYRSRLCGERALEASHLDHTCDLGRNVLQQLPESSWELPVVCMAGVQLMVLFFFLSAGCASRQSLQS